MQLKWFIASIVCDWEPLLRMSSVMWGKGAWLSLALTELQSTGLVPVSSCFLAPFESCVEWFDSGLNWISEYRLVKWCLGLFYANKVAIDWTGMFAIDESIWKLLYSKYFGFMVNRMCWNAECALFLLYWVSHLKVGFLLRGLVPYDGSTCLWTKPI